MMDEKIFEQLENEYEHMEKSYKLWINLYHKDSAKKCYNKGYLLDVLPFEHELSGYKLHKKPLQRMVTFMNNMYIMENNLKLIQKVHSNGYKVNIYANIKVNFKNLKAYLYETLKENISSFFDSHNKENVETLGIRLWIYDLEPMLDVNYRIVGDKNFSVSEWSFYCVSNIQFNYKSFHLKYHLPSQKNPNLIHYHME